MKKIFDITQLREFPSLSDWKKLFELESKVGIYTIGSRDQGKNKREGVFFSSPGVFQILNTLKFSDVEEFPMTQKELFRRLFNNFDLKYFIRAKHEMANTTQKSALNWLINEEKLVDSMTAAAFSKKYKIKYDKSLTGKSIVYYLTAKGHLQYEAYLHQPWLALSMLNFEMKGNFLRFDQNAIDVLSELCFGKSLDSSRFRMNRNYFKLIGFEESDFLKTKLDDIVKEFRVDFKFLEKMYSPFVQLIREYHFFDVMRNELKWDLHDIEKSEFLKPDPEKDKYYYALEQFQNKIDSDFYWQENFRKGMLFLLESKVESLEDRAYSLEYPKNVFTKIKGHLKKVNLHKHDLLLIAYLDEKIW